MMIKIAAHIEDLKRLLFVIWVVSKAAHITNNRGSAGRRYLMNLTSKLPVISKYGTIHDSMRVLLVCFEILNSLEEMSPVTEIAEAISNDR